jgi:hypothetical protein
MARYEDSFTEFKDPEISIFLNTAVTNIQKISYIRNPGLYSLAVGIKERFSGDKFRKNFKMMNVAQKNSHVQCILLWTLSKRKSKTSISELFGLK